MVQVRIGRRGRRLCEAGTRRRLCAAAAGALLLASASASAAEAIHRPAPGLTIRHLAGEVWLHRSDREGHPCANGLIVATREGSLLVNTTPTVEGTRAVLDWVSRELPKPVRLAIITGADDERMGGLSALVEAQVPVHALERTAEQARSSRLGWTPDHYSFESETRISAGDYSLQLFTAGDGLPSDELLVWIPEARVLFGGGLVRAGQSHSVGPVSPRLLQSWSEALHRTRFRYPGVRWVVPADGDAGGADLIDHTLELLQQAAAR